MRFCGVRFWWGRGDISELRMAFVGPRAWHVCSQSSMDHLDINAFMGCHHLLSHHAAPGPDPGWLLLAGEGKVAEHPTSHQANEQTQEERRVSQAGEERGEDN